MSTILMSIKPIYVNKIFSGEKKYEYRKRICSEPIDRIIVYSSAPIKKVVGELIIKQVLYDDKSVIWNKTKMNGGVTKNKYDDYYKNCDKAVAFEIEKVILYDNPKTLNDYNIKVAPQSYVYINK
ncbi:MAG: hypothetical protein IKG56_00705 [Clostridia bacterium]|nr:hypothetical protein [Clostridia bacterium]